MEETTNYFFSNPIKFHILVIINKFEKNPEIIFDNNIENTFLISIIINSINSFREIISKNNLNSYNTWKEIGQSMRDALDEITKIFEKELEKGKLGIKKTEKSKEKTDLGNINILKIRIINLCLYLLANNSEKILAGDDKDKIEFKNLLHFYIEKESVNQNNYVLFIKNYIIKLIFLIYENNHNNNINISFLNYLLFIIKEYNSSFMDVKTKNNFVLYIKKIIDTPKNLKIAFSKKISGKQMRSRPVIKKICLQTKISWIISVPIKAKKKMIN
jgi:hypothetical protein